MDQIEQMLKAMNLEIVAEEKPDTEYGTSNRGTIVVKVGNRFYKTIYYVDSYGGDLSIESTKEVKPRPVEKVEYV